MQLTAKALNAINKEKELKTGRLDLSKCELQTVPEEIMQLPWLTVLDLSDNQITELTNLQGLLHLQKLLVSRNRVKKMAGLDLLNCLQVLDLVYNDIEEIENISGLLALSELWLLGNKIKEIKNLDSLGNLEVLILSHNQIGEIKNLNRLYHLTQLSLADNNISAIKNLSKLQELTIVNLANNPISVIKDIVHIVALPSLIELRMGPLSSNDLHIPPEMFFGDNCLPALKSYFASVEKGKFQSTEIPVILVGNSTAGKTSLRYFLSRNIFPPPGDSSTHGVEPSIWHPDEESFANIAKQDQPTDIQFYFWDFGGQEYYHSTHRLFFSRTAIYIIVWEQKTNKQAIETIDVKIKNRHGEIETTQLPVEIFPYEYWFNSIRHLATDVRESPILLLQSKMDEEGNGQIGYPDAELMAKNNAVVLQLSVRDAYEMNGRGKKDPAVDLLLNRLLSAAQQLAKTFVYGGLWESVKKKLQESRHENTWSPQRFLAMLRELDPAIPEHGMLSYILSLKAFRLVFYEPEDALLKDYVFINPGWVTEQIYQVLDPSVLANEGEFSRAHVVEKLGDKLAPVFIALMKKFELIFENEEVDGFIAPQYLPAALSDKRKSNELKARFDFARPDYMIRFADFMPRQIMLRFLAAYGNNAVGKYYWKNGIAFTLKKMTVLLLCDYEKKQFSVYTDKGNRFIQRLVFEKLLQLAENTEALQLAAGNDDFVAYPLLHQEFPGGHPSGNNTIRSVNGTRVPLENFQHLFAALESVRKDFPVMDSEPIGPRKIKVFISYAHADNEKGLVDLFVNDLVRQLKALEDDYLFEVFKDDQIIMGSHWNQTLEKEVRIADVAVLLLSASFLQSQYIQKNELAVFLERNINSGAAILAPVYFDPFMFDKYTLLKPYQFFKPNGQVYGPAYAHLKDDLCYGDLVDFDPQSGLPLPNRSRSRYMVDFAEALEKSLHLKYAAAK